MNTRHDANEPPPAMPKSGYSKRVLVYYESQSKIVSMDGFAISFYDYFPFDKNEPGWVDFSDNERVPKYWWTLPTIDE